MESLTPPLLWNKLSVPVYVCARGISFASYYDFSIGYWNCSDSVAFCLHFIERKLTSYTLFRYLHLKHSCVIYAIYVPFEKLMHCNSCFY